MSNNTLNIIVAADEQGVIGYKGAMPWHLAADLKYFKAVTMGHNVIMGRKTYEAIGRPLPGRRNLVVSRRPGLSIEGCEVFMTLEAAIEAADAEAFVIGGAQIYRQAWLMAHSLYLTRVHTLIADYDAAIPVVADETWRLLRTEFHAADEKNDYDMTFEVYVRK